MLNRRKKVLDNLVLRSNVQSVHNPKEVTPLLSIHAGKKVEPGTEGFNNAKIDRFGYVTAKKIKGYPVLRTSFPSCG